MGTLLQYTISAFIQNLAGKFKNYVNHSNMMNGVDDNDKEACDKFGKVSYIIEYHFFAKFLCFFIVFRI